MEVKRKQKSPRRPMWTAARREASYLVVERLDGNGKHMLSLVEKKDPFLTQVLNSGFGGKGQQGAERNSAVTSRID
jgi:hypothetical protein